MAHIIRTLRSLGPGVLKSSGVIRQIHRRKCIKVVQIQPESLKKLINVFNENEFKCEIFYLNKENSNK